MVACIQIRYGLADSGNKSPNSSTCTKLTSNAHQLIQQLARFDIWARNLAFWFDSIFNSK